MRRGKLKAIAAVALLSVAAFLFSTGFSRAEDYASGRAGYLKSATYYSDDWVVNFWNSESAHMEQELAQIAADGFNSIILVVPWREFQPRMSPASYNSYAWDKLDRVMEAAAGQNLGVMLRVGYTWDYAGTDNVLARYQALMYDGGTRAAWREYVGRLYERAGAHENFCGGFLTWEDFWNFTESAAALGKGRQSREMARRCGYTDYAEENYNLEELSGLYQEEIASLEELYLPGKDSPARKVFFEFYNQFLNRLLEESQQVFPGLSFEVRLDGDQIRRTDGTVEGYMHADTFPCGSAAYSCTMYSIPMGQANRYERILAQEALVMAPMFLGNVLNHNGGKPVYIDQFLFTDNTPGFSHNAQLLDGEKAAYLGMMRPVLEQMSMGYGIWTYRNYGDNKLYNSQFGLGQDQWMLSGGAKTAKRGGSMAAVLPSGAAVSQSIAARSTGEEGTNTRVRFKAGSKGASDLTVRLGSMSKSVSVKGSRTVELEFPGNGAPVFTVENRGAEVWLDDIFVYTFVTDGELYGMDGEPLACLEAVRNLNRSLGVAGE